MFKHLVKASILTPWTSVEKTRHLRWARHVSLVWEKSILVGHDFVLHRQCHASQNIQSVLLPGPERIRASRLTNDPTKFVSAIPNVNLKTVYETLEYGMKASNDGDCVGKQCKVTEEFIWIKYSDVMKKTQHVGSGLINLGLKPCNSTLVGVFALNRIEFLLTMYGCAGYSMVLVPLYNSLGKDAVHFIINQASFPLVICNNNKNTLDLLKSRSKLPSLKTLVIMDPPSAEVVAASKDAKIDLLTFEELEEIGKNKKHSLVLPKPSDLFCIPYTSGTTGTPKGVMLTHENTLSCLSSLVIGYGPAGVPGGTIISYLPPAHIYEIMNEVASLYFARRIAFFDDDIKKLFDVIKVLKPTVVPLVPRLMNFLYTKAIEDMKSHKVKGYLMKLALLRKESMIKKGKITNKTIWDKFLLKKFQNLFGGNAHIICTTSAPISSDVMKFFRCASGCYIFEAYGQTEVLAATMTLPYEHDGGFVGPSLPCNYVKLTDIPEMNYFSKDDVGEICFKGVNVFQGYFKNQEATDESIDKDGWHHSGDIGQWLPNGALRVIDRKKHIFKLSQGEYIAPEKVENAYSHSPLVAQIYVDGLSDKNYIVAIILPDHIAFVQWAKNLGFPTEDASQLMKNKEVRTAFLKELHQHGQSVNLNPLEQVRNIYLTSEPFSVDNDLLTPTLKLKRNKARKYFDSILVELYSEESLIQHTET